MALADKIREHFRSIGVQKAEVPEWGEGGKPLILYYNPITLAERQKARAAMEREGDVLAYIDVLLMKALDAQGKPVFTLEDKHTLRHEADPDVIRRLGLLMMLVPEGPEMGKDSSKTPSSG